MFAHLHDPALPALERLTSCDLDRITGTPGTRLLRARYRPGTRAVLHVDLGDGAEGSVWFFAGTKAQGLSRKLPDARLDATSGALFESFPQDHRIPQLARFVAEAATLAPRLIGCPVSEPPRMLRYRPGLSATFRMTSADGQVFFVKQMPDQDVQAQARLISDLSGALVGGQTGVADVAGVIPDLGLIAYFAARGKPLDTVLRDGGSDRAAGFLSQVLQALQELWSVPLRPSRVLDRSTLLARADQACQMISLLDPLAGQTAAALATGLRDRAVEIRAVPIHADIKLEHVFMSGQETTLIDTESLSLGDPDYDLAKLEARLMMAELDGTITRAVARSAITKVRSVAGPHFPWFATCARLQCAKYFAQRFDPSTIAQMRVMLAPG